MRVPILGGGGSNVSYVPDDASTTYSQLHGNQTWYASPAGWYQVVPISGVFSHLLYATRGSPGGGKSTTLNLYKNGAATALSATITDLTGNIVGDIVHQVSAIDGDLVIIQHVPVGTPSLYAPRHTVLFTPSDPTKGIILGNTEGFATGELNNGATEYASIASGGVRLNATEVIWQQPMPTSGKFTYARVTLDAAPDPAGSDGYRFTLRKNGADTGIVITITGNNTTATATVDVSFVADDAFNWMIEPIGVPAAEPHAGWGLVYQPDTPGEVIVLGQTYDQPHQTNTEHNTLTHWAITPWQTFSDAARDVENALWEMTIKKLHVRLNTAPGAGKSYTFTLYKRTWDIVGADTALSVLIADLAISGGDDVNEVAAADYDQLRMKVVPSGTPALTYLAWGLVMEVALAATRSRAFVIG